jgi:hypothetical protein
LVGLGALISKISIDSIPPQALMVNLPVAFQFTLFGLGIFMMLFVIPGEPIIQEDTKENETN